MDLTDYKKEIAKLSVEEKKQRNLYLKRMNTGEYYGPMTGKPSLDKPWLKHHTDEAIMSDIEDITLYQRLLLNNKDHLDGVALKYFDRDITYKELFLEVNKIADALIKSGVKTGDTITMLSVTIPETVELFYAANKIGVTVNILDPRSNESLIKSNVEKSNTKMVFVIDKYKNKIGHALSENDVKIVVVSPMNSIPTSKKISMIMESIKTGNKYDVEKDWYDFISWNKFHRLGSKNAEVKTTDNSLNPIACIDYTGGTTGTPKGALLSNYGLGAVAKQYEVLDIDIKRGQLMLNIMPMFLSYGIGMLNMSLNLGVTNILIPLFDAKKMADYLIKYRFNHFMGVPSHYEPLLHDKRLDGMDLSFLITTGAGGDITLEEFEKSITNFFELHNCHSGLLNGYGCTEASSAVATCTPKVNKIGSVGIPLVKNNIMILDNNGEEVGYNQEGELVINGPSIMVKYLDNEEETNKVLKEYVTGEVWLYPEDIAYMDEDGLLYVRNRKKRVIIRPDGHNVFPSTIENTILKHPAVLSCGVIGIKSDEHVNGSWTKAMVVLKEEYKGQEDRIEQELRKLCLQELPERDGAEYYGFIDELPYTPAGKVNYIELEKMENDNSRVRKIHNK